MKLKLLIVSMAAALLVACTAPVPAAPAAPTPSMSGALAPVTPVPATPAPSELPVSPELPTAKSLISANGGEIAPHTPRTFTQEELDQLISQSNRKPFVDFSLPLFDGGTISKSDLLGKVAVVNAMASWCRYCIVELPFLTEAATKYSQSDVIFVGFQVFETNYADGQKSLQKDLDETGANFPIAIDESGIVSSFMSSRGSVPVTMILDRSGVVRYYYPGALPSTETLTKIIDFVLQYENELPSVG